MLFATTVFGTGFLVVYGFNRIEAQIGSLIMVLEVLFAVILGYSFFQETLNLSTTLGGLMIIFAVFLPNLPRTFPRRG